MNALDDPTASGVDSRDMVGQFVGRSEWFDQAVADAFRTDGVLVTADGGRSRTRTSPA